MNIEELTYTFMNKKYGVSFQEFRTLWEYFTPYKLKDDIKLKDIVFKYAEILNINKELTVEEIAELKYTNCYLCQAIYVSDKIKGKGGIINVK